MYDPNHPDSRMTAAKARLRLEQERQRKMLTDRNGCAIVQHQIATPTSEEDNI